MPINQQRDHIIAYDIGEPRRLCRIHRYLKKRAMPIQYSVFLIKCTPERLSLIMDELKEMIDPAIDDIRSYTLPKKAKIITLGQQGLIQDVLLLDGNENGYEQHL